MRGVTYPLAALGVLIVWTLIRAPSSQGADPDRTDAGIPDRTLQLVVVTAADWTTVTAEMRCFERPDRDSIWREVLPQWNAVVGRAGVAWGIGLHRDSHDGPFKREGDGKAPAGMFRLVEAFGFVSAQDAKLSRFPYRQLTNDSEGIDDPASRYYNRIVDARTVPRKDWNTSELMRRPEPYRWGAVVAHNWNQVPGAGSCIFLHVWEGAGIPTSGCTAMAEEHMVRVLRWLDRSKHPVLVQLPIAEYRRQQSAWKLPEL